ncbi:MAG: glycerol-3-phosphate dehydrogenase, partial [Methylocapsa sp.]|nr:glycerol-3-phosphate dehydrogenase [Methylocapsa sp.]
PEVVLTSFSGVRPLHADAAADASAASRDYWLVLDAPSGGAPLLSVLGGKITTYRRLAQEAIDRLSPYLKPPRAGHWTAAAPLPGGDMKDGDFVASLHGLRGAYPWLDEERAMRLARAYGTRAKRILGEAKGVSELGRDFGAGLSQAEIGYMIDCEFAHSSEDILWRRSKLGLHLSATEKACVEAYVAERTNA